MGFLASRVLAKLPDLENMNFLRVLSALKKQKLKKKNKTKKGETQKTFVISFCICL